MGALGTGQCPNGGVHVYDITGANERNPVKVGYWNIDTVGTTTDAPDGRCTAHVFDIHEAEQVMTIAYYNGGVRVVDLSGLEGISLGGVQLAGAGMKEIASFRHPDGDTWSFKTPADRAIRQLLRVRQRHRPRPGRLPLHGVRAQVHEAGPLADAGRGPEPVAPGLDGRLSVAVPYGVVVDSVKVSALL